MIRISFREFEWILKTLETLRVHRRHLHERRHALEYLLAGAKNQEQASKIHIEISKIDEELARITTQIRKHEDLEDKSVPGRAERRKIENEEIRTIGFSVPQHAQLRYNERFTPYLTREQLVEVLKKMGLSSKIKGEDHEIIKLADNFHVAVEDHKVITFRFNNDYYKKYNGNPPKFELKPW